MQAAAAEVKGVRAGDGDRTAPTTVSTCLQLSSVPGVRLPMSTALPPDRTLFGLSLLAAPLLFAASSFYWTGDGEYGVVGGTLLVMGSVFWIQAFAGLFSVLRPRMPGYAAWGFLTSVYGALCGGAAFAFQGMFIALHEVSHDRSLAALSAHPVVANLIFWVGGPAFPISLLTLGIVLARTRTVSPWVGTMLAVGGALFPLARIPRVEIIAHSVDLLILIPAAFMGFNVLRGRPIGGRAR